jgi:2-polyprenyl-3-methyl-5-hydroxy-6-metoxy-1,4-benzoquinol methylase
MSIHEMNMRGLYEGVYVNATYGDKGINGAYERIIVLSPSQSDNEERVNRVLEFAAKHFPRETFLSRPPSVLDVGSGLCVFLRRMKSAGWDCTALDPDSRAVTHARDTVGVHAVRGQFLDVQALEEFDVVTFNKVLEHVEDPVPMLAKAREHLRPGGFVYVELPDGEEAAHEGPGREEFFVDHHHVFSLASAAILAHLAGFVVKSLERVREPSSKYTIRAFMVLGRSHCNAQTVSAA